MYYENLLQKFLGYIFSKRILSGQPQISILRYGIRLKRK